MPISLVGSLASLVEFATFFTQAKALVLSNGAKVSKEPLYSRRLRRRWQKKCATFSFKLPIIQNKIPTSSITAEIASVFLQLVRRLPHLDSSSVFRGRQSASKCDIEKLKKLFFFFLVPSYGTRLPPRACSLKGPSSSAGLSEGN